MRELLRKLNDICLCKGLKNTILTQYISENKSCFWLGCIVYYIYTREQKKKKLLRDSIFPSKKNLLASMAVSARDIFMARHIIRLCEVQRKQGEIKSILALLYAVFYFPPLPE